jgi:hypothetical protein
MADDLAFMRAVLEVAREHDEDFDGIWQETLGHIERRPTSSYLADQDTGRRRSTL